MLTVVVFRCVVIDAVSPLRYGISVAVSSISGCSGTPPPESIRARADGRDRLFSGALALPNGLPKLSDAAGLIEVQRGSLTIRMNYENFDDYGQPLLGGQGQVGTYVTSLDKDLRCRIAEAVKRAYCSGAPDSERSLTATALVVGGMVT